MRGTRAAAGHLNWFSFAVWSRSIFGGGMGGASDQPGPDSSFTPSPFSHHPSPKAADGRRFVPASLAEAVQAGGRWSC